ncbi:MAG TPA: hypothetical protein VFB91_07310 [Terriglobales bacterium]|nr:hypothetical protein [Terriglobales bacterium]
MTSKSALFALAVVVLMGSMAVAALAEDQGLNVYAMADSAYWPESGNQFNEAEGSQAAGSEIREPMETGAIPDKSVSSFDLSSQAPGDEPTVQVGGLSFRPGIDLAP